MVGNLKVYQKSNVKILMCTLWKDFAHFRSHKRVPPARFEPQAEICFQICTLHPAEFFPFLGEENESFDKEIKLYINMHCAGLERLM